MSRNREKYSWYYSILIERDIKGQSYAQASDELRDEREGLLVKIEDLCALEGYTIKWRRR